MGLNGSNSGQKGFLGVKKWFKRVKRGQKGVQRGPKGSNGVEIFFLGG